MKPRILITMHYMELGGAESALLGLLQAHDPEKADLDLFLYAQRGELMAFIPMTKVNLLPEIPDYSLLESPITEVLKRGYWKLALARLIGKQETNNYSKKNIKGLNDFSALTFQQHRTVKILPDINPDVEYDLAISFNNPHYIVLDRVKAKKKLGWIHTDFTKVFLNYEMELQMWNRLDYIASISKEVSNQFCTVFPSLRKKVVPIENILSKEYMRNRSEEFIPNDIIGDDNAIKLLSIGRFCHAKRFDEIGTICKHLLNNLPSEFSNIKWFIIGYGPESERLKIHNNIEEEGMQDHVVLLGKRSNPYPYIKLCDFYIQPSRYEGKSITVREAQVFCKPVVITNYATASSQIISGEDGVIVPMDIALCAKGIASLIKDIFLQKHIKEFLKSHDYCYESEIDKIYQLATTN